MRVAILHDWLVTWRGGEVCLAEIRNLYPDCEVFTLFHSDELTDKNLPGVIIHCTKFGRLPLVLRKHRIFIPLVPILVLIMSYQLKVRHKSRPFDAVISISHCGVKNALIPKDLDHICYLLTPVRYIWDQFPRYCKNIGLRILFYFPRLFFQIWDILGSKGVNKFISISDFIVKRVNRYYQRESDRVYPPVRIARYNYNELDSLSRDYFLIVNALVPYKNTDLAVRVFSELRFPLKIVGSGPEKTYLKKIANNYIEFLDNVDQLELERLYKGAKALIFCAEEDFGIVPVEANHFGTPVIFYRSGGVVETQVEGETWTGIGFSELSERGLKVAVEEFFKRENSIDRLFCVKNAERFSVDNFSKNFKFAVESNK